MLFGDVLQLGVLLALLQSEVVSQPSYLKSLVL